MVDRVQGGKKVLKQSKQRWAGHTTEEQAVWGQDCTRCGGKNGDKVPAQGIRGLEMRLM